MSDLLNGPVMYEMTSEQYVEQIRAAEKRGAVKALREEAASWRSSADSFDGAFIADALDDTADHIEIGVVTL